MNKIEFEKWKFQMLNNVEHEYLYKIGAVFEFREFVACLEKIHGTLLDTVDGFNLFVGCYKIDK